MRARLLIGSLMAAFGFAVMVAGAVISATVEADGSRPHVLAGWAMCLVGLAVGSTGLWICGVRLD